MNYLDPQQSAVAWFVVLGGMALLCVAVYGLNALLKRFGVREHRTDRMSGALLEMDKIIRPSAQNIVQARRQRKRSDKSGEGPPPR
jgi:hypothetical protein